MVSVEHFSIDSELVCSSILLSEVQSLDYEDKYVKWLEGDEEEEQEPEEEPEEEMDVDEDAE